MNNRDYVIVAEKYQRGGLLMFWGSKSKDGDERSYSGYTINFDACEKYTIEDIKSNPYKHKIYGVDSFDIYSQEHFVINIKDLSELGLRKKTVYSY